MSRSSETTGIFSARLRAAREARGLSQSELAVRSGFQPSAISHFETQRRSPSFDNLRKLADALRVTTDYLLGRVDDMVATGSSPQELFRNYSQMSAADQEILDEMAARLAERNRKNG